jgi:hypothetical protein
MSVKVKKINNQELVGADLSAQDSGEIPQTIYYLKMQSFCCAKEFAPTVTADVSLT